MRINVSRLVQGLLLSVSAAVCLLAMSLSLEAQNPRVLFETTMGDIEIELFEKEAPITVANFLSYVKKGHYDGTIFHRVIPEFVVQGGGLEKSMKERPTNPPIKNEAGNGLKNDKMTLSMARTRDANSATSQFYINLKYNQSLDRKYAPDRVGYCVFGKVVKGEDMVEKMATVRTASVSGHQDVPIDPITLIKATILDVEKKE
jgi:cyclophilin family peptidyl-prolyl cis-trans isomerase